MRKRNIVAFLASLLAPGALLLAQKTPETVLAYDARVRVILKPEIAFFGQGLDARWVTGQILGGSRRCAFFTPDSLQMTPLGTIVPGISGAFAPRLLIEFSRIERIQVSSIYDGQFVSGGSQRFYSEGADLSGETWIDVPRESLRMDRTLCPDPP